jgi:hypothetical protein
MLFGITDVHIVIARPSFPQTGQHSNEISSIREDVL